MYFTSLTTNGYYFRKEHYPVVPCNGGLCLQWGGNWNFVCCLGEFWA